VLDRRDRDAGLVADHRAQTRFDDAVGPGGDTGLVAADVGADKQHAGVDRARREGDDHRLAAVDADPGELDRGA
jgi:hypothetical protein